MQDINYGKPLRGAHEREPGDQQRRKSDAGLMLVKKT